MTRMHGFQTRQDKTVSKTSHRTFPFKSMCKQPTNESHIHTHSQSTQIISSFGLVISLGEEAQGTAGDDKGKTNRRGRLQTCPLIELHKSPGRDGTAMQAQHQPHALICKSGGSFLEAIVAHYVSYFVACNVIPHW